MRSPPRRAARATLPISLCAVLGACSATPTPSVNIPAPPAVPVTAAPATPPAGPKVLFVVEGDVLAPVACHDGKKSVPADTDECMNMAPEGATVILDTGAKVKVGPTVEVPCRGSELNTFSGRKAESPDLAKANYALWPDTAGGALQLADGGLKATAKELEAMTALLVRETENLFEVKPKLEVTSGLLADMDGDGAPDRVFAAFEEGRLYGVIAVFAATAPDKAINLSVQQFNHPRLAGTTELDGRPGREVLISGAFIEGIGDQNMTSAVSGWVLALPLPGGKDDILGMWGCRMF